jgi:hypothetical protein
MNNEDEGGASLQAADAALWDDDGVGSDLAAAIRQSAVLAWLHAEASWKYSEHVRTHGCICFSPNGGMFTWGCRIHSDLLIKRSDWERGSRLIRGLARRASQLRRSVRALEEVKVDVAKIPGHLTMSDVAAVLRAAGIDVEAEGEDADAVRPER